jgi:hypothetical protein
MNKNMKVRKKLVKKKMSINFKRFSLACMVSLSTLVILGLLINKIIHRENHQAKTPPPFTQPKISRSPSFPQVNSTWSSPVLSSPIPKNQTSIEIPKQPNNQNLTTTTNNDHYGNTDRQHMTPIPEIDYQQVKSNISYKPKKQPTFTPNNELQRLVNDIVSSVQSSGLPTEHLSISLINLNSPKCCEYAGKSNETARFAASITKLFWMVYLYGLYQEGHLKRGEVPEKAVRKMIKDSDNESASLIVDKITQTESGDELPDGEFQVWYQKRLSLNKFFQEADYKLINISQKLFPTSYSKNDGPMGRDLQIRKQDNEFYPPVRNYTTTHNVARLLLEIEQEKSISKKYSNQMKTLLKRSLKKEDWQNKQFNAIEGFLGESLPENTYFLSKMGWNSKTRNDAAIIGTPDGKHKYILVVFGDHPSFYQDKKIFPEISRMVYEQMTK